MVNTFCSPAKSNAPMPWYKPQLTRGCTAAVLSPIVMKLHSPHTICSHLTCFGYMTIPVNLKFCFKLLCNFSALYHFAECWFPSSQLSESQQLFWPSSQSLTFGLPLQSFCCGGLFLSTHTLLNKHPGTNSRGTKKTINLITVIIKITKIVTKILHKEVLIHVNKRENIKHGWQSYS